ncbi:surface antigen [Phyllobacterium myrsinacearum]|uniref:Surface antigen n=2 Tax=Phyllobacterium myrsinacearum TaxID=28101 RepID=A0A839E9Z1_9HYPH|nr:surface antigen [Phyllobacterium myrsinacearum]
MMKSQIALSLIAVLLLSACSTTSGPKGSGGTFSRLTGKSSEPATSGVLAALGNGLIGNASLEPADRKRALQAEYQALEYSPAGKAIEWKNSSGSRAGEVVAAQPYQVGSQNCRQYTHTIRADGTPQTARGTACRNEDGSWTPLN